MVSEVRFARSGDVDIAYRVVGDGPIDLVYAQGAYTHLETSWELRSSVATASVLVSGTVRDLVAGSGLEFEDRGTAELRGVPGEWRLFAVR